MKTMKNRLLIFIILFIAVIFTGCGNNSGHRITHKDSLAVKIKSGKKILELLQGKWQNTDDSTDFVIFENNHRKRIAGKMTKWDDEVFILSDSCCNESNRETNLEIEKDRYISSMESDMCWYILKLDSKTLLLSYISTGNIISYQRKE
jgi:hypothetical protein